MIKKEYKYSDEIGLLINFGSQSLDFKRLTNEKKLKVQQQKKIGLQ